MAKGLAAGIIFAGFMFGGGSAMADPYTQPQNETYFNVPEEAEVALRDYGFIRYNAVEETDGSVRVSGLKLADEAVSISLHGSVDDHPLQPVGKLEGYAEFRVDPNFGIYQKGWKITIESGMTAQFELRFWPATDECTAYNVHVASAEQEAWLLTLDVPEIESAV